MSSWNVAKSGIALVYGAGPGMGRAAAVAFAKEGFAVALLNRKADSVKDAQKEIKEAGGKAAFFSCDVTDSAAVKSSLDAINSSELSENGKHKVEVIVYNAAAGFKRAKILECDPVSVENSFRVHTMGLLNVIQAAVPGMIKRGRGTVLVTSATAAFRGSAAGPAFSAAAFAQRSLTQCLAKTHAKDNIHAALIRFDCVLDTSAAKYGMDTEKAGNTNEIANTLVQLHYQHRNAWTNELDIRPFSESWTF